MYNNLTTSEQAIMNVLWESKQWMTINELIEYFEKSGKIWKRQTVNTFLSRLIGKNLVVKNGRKYIYAYTRAEFEARKATEMLDSFYGSSLKNFIVALSGGHSISREEVEELKAYLDKLQPYEEI